MFYLSSLRLMARNYVVLWQNQFQVFLLSPPLPSVAVLLLVPVTLWAIVSAKMATLALLAPTLTLTISLSRLRSLSKSTILLLQSAVSAAEKFLSICNY